MKKFKYTLLALPLCFINTFSAEAFLGGRLLYSTATKESMLSIGGTLPKKPLVLGRGFSSSALLTASDWKGLLEIIGPSEEITVQTNNEFFSGYFNGCNGDFLSLKPFSGHGAYVIPTDQIDCLHMPDNETPLFEEEKEHGDIEEPVGEIHGTEKPVEPEILSSVSEPLTNFIGKKVVVNYTNNGKPDWARSTMTGCDSNFLWLDHDFAIAKNRITNIQTEESDDFGYISSDYDTDRD